MNARQCPDDLLVAARGRRLSDLERQAMSAHLVRCDLCRAGELAAGLLREPFFSGGAPLDADRALVERVAERAGASVARGARRAHHGLRRVAVAVVVFLGLGGVAFAWIGRNLVSPRAVDRDLASEKFPVVPRAHRSTQALTRTPAPPVASTRPVSPAKRFIAARSTRENVVVPASSATAASLFAEATRARHDGDLRRGVALYGALRSTFPDSEQARVAAVSMGDLLLRLDEPTSALRAFDAYLADVRIGPLREEALFGRARCLKQVGDDTAEAETWVRLLREFPSSAYRAVARHRLDELR
jgi:hypothetical protein